ncbi:MAG TPA: hypothetical protein VGR54_04970, partial [Nitrosopumilaceae archaeon]|nr:hypothetical protein [Nitrosopumilaceae archaeon]
IAHFDKEYADIQNRINALQSNATKVGIQLQGVIEVNNLLADIKQKIANGQTVEANQELDEVDSLMADMEQTVNIASQQQNETMPSQNDTMPLQNDTMPLEGVSMQ